MAVTASPAKASSRRLPTASRPSVQPAGLAALDSALRTAAHRGAVEPLTTALDSHRTAAGRVWAYNIAALLAELIQRQVEES